MNWFINRLRTMSMTEIGFRLNQYVQKTIEQRTAMGRFPKVGLLHQATRIMPAQSSYPASTHSMLQVFECTLDYNKPINWHQDPSSGKEFPLSFSKNIDIRNDTYGSAKHVWEINRLQFLTHICYNYKETKEDHFLELFISVNEDWIDENPFLKGVNWYSNIEVNLRLITWFLCWEILEANNLIAENTKFSKFVEHRWLPVIHLHCKYSYDNPSKFSSANNHLISEGAGLFIATSLWKFNESTKWNRYAKTILEKEMQLQHSEHGINKEEAAEYIQFITDFFLLSYIVGKNCDNPFSERYEKQLHNIFLYIYHLMDIKGWLPYYGDEDDGRTFILESEAHPNNFRSLLTSGAILFKDEKLKSKSNGFDQKNQILFGHEGANVFAEIPEKQLFNKSKFYPKEGHFIFRKEEHEKAIYLHFDAAELGFLSIAAHGHADALSFVLNVDGQPIFVDSGTYTYHTEFEWRKYFIGTLAHNTLRVAEKDQAKICGPTLWREHYKTKVIDTEANEIADRVTASHDGYQGLGVTHQREIIFEQAKNRITINDEVILAENRELLFELPFHLHPTITPTELADNKFEISAPGARKVSLELDQQLESVVIRGQEDPLLGWYSKSFQKREPCTVIYHRFTKDQSFNLTTVINIQDYEN